MKNQKLMYVLIAIVFLILVVAVVLFLISHYNDTNINETTRATSVADINITPEETSVIFVGIEDDEYLEYLNFICFNNSKGKISYVSIPADTYINPDVIGYNVSKIGGLFKEIKKEKSSSKSSFETLTLLMTKAFGIYIDDYILLSYADIIELIDKFDGVKYELKEDIKYDNEKLNIHLELSRGMKTLSGKEVVAMLDNASETKNCVDREQIFLNFVKVLHENIYSKNTKVSFHAKCLEILSKINSSIGNKLTNYVDYIYSMGISDFNGNENLEIKRIGGCEVADLENHIYYVINRQKAVNDLRQLIKSNYVDLLFDNDLLFTTTNSTYISQNYYAKEDN